MAYNFEIKNEDEFEIEANDIRVVGVFGGNHISFFNTHDNIQETYHLYGFGEYMFDDETFYKGADYDKTTEEQQMDIDDFIRVVRSLRGLTESTRK